ncbi:MAG: hypothetical protein IIC58_01570 [Proteobacteria bacterium]|nr:hypothetical protein [Pseudomonadota bacterium]
MPTYSKHHGLIGDHPVSTRLGGGAVPYLQSIKRKHTGSPIKRQGLSRIADQHPVSSRR